MLLRKFSLIVFCIALLFMPSAVECYFSIISVDWWHIWLYVTIAYDFSAFWWLSCVCLTFDVCNSCTCFGVCWAVCDTSLTLVKSQMVYNMWQTRRFLSKAPGVS